MDSQVDHTTGLLSLREGLPMDVWCTEQVHEDLSGGFPLFTMLKHWNGGLNWQRIEASEAAARAKHADFADALGAFQQAVQHSPALIQQMQAASDPGEFAYSTGKRAMELEKVGSIDELLKAERAKWEAEAKAQMPEPRFPRSTVNDGSVSRQSMVLPTGDDPVLPMDRTR